MCETAVGSILSSVSVDKVVELYNYYLNDFVRYVHHSGNRDDLRDIEYKVCMHVCMCVCVYRIISLQSHPRVHFPISLS